MTTLSQIRQPLQVISMSNEQPGQRKSKRLAGEPRIPSGRRADAGNGLQETAGSMEKKRKLTRRAASSVWDEQDGDFVFTRGPKRVKKAQSNDEDATTPTPDKHAPLPAKKSGRGRPPKQPAAAAKDVPKSSTGTKKSNASVAATTAKAKTTASTAAAAAGRRSSRRNASPDPMDESPQLVVPKRATRKTTRKSNDTIEEEAEVEEPAPAPAAAEPRQPSRGKTAASRTKRKHDQVDAPAPATVAPTSNEWTPSAGTARSKTANKKRRDKTPPPPSAPAAEEHHDGDVTGPIEESQAAKITLPTSDTPMINRNKEMRKKGGTGAGGGSRRSSLGMRGRRASSLIESGHSAIPHHDVPTKEFYKHIAADGLSEPRRMKQLLTWCGERALLQKPPHGSSNGHIINGARAIQESLLRDFKSKSQCSDWFDREDAPEPKAPVIRQPNPRNLEHQTKIEELEAKVQRLKEEKKTWLSLKNTQPPELPPLFPEDSASSSSQPVLPDLKALDATESQMLSYLTDPATSFDSVRSSTQTRLRDTQASLELKIDRLADGVHKLLQRVDTAGREADKVLELSATRLKKREEKEKAAAGTREMPTMEVLRSLGRILPEGGGINYGGSDGEEG